MLLTTRSIKKKKIGECQKNKLLYLLDMENTKRIIFVFLFFFFSKTIRIIEVGEIQTKDLVRMLIELWSFATFLFSVLKKQIHFLKYKIKIKNKLVIKHL